MLINKLGYSIPLVDLTEPKLKELKQILTVKPTVLSDYDFGNDTNFPVYRVSNTRIYIPKFFGIEKYGMVKNNIKDGIDVDFIFSGCLKEHQINFCNNVLNELKTNNSCIAVSQTGSGKCEIFNTPHIMYDGSIKMVQDIQIGDLLMGDDSNPREVLSLGRGEGIMYEIIPTKGESHTFNGDHILCLKCTNIGEICYKKDDRLKKWTVNWFDNKHIKIRSKGFEHKQEAIDYISNFNEESKICEISINDYLKLSKTLKHILKLYRVPVNFKYRDVPIDPYIIGLWLGDGNSADVCFTNQDSEIIVYLKQKLPEYKCYLEKCSGQYRYRFQTTEGIGKNYVKEMLKQLNLINNKHVPDIYRINSREIRLQLLAGILDTDGHLGKNGCYEFRQVNEKIMDDIIFIARSLGFASYKSAIKTSCTVQGDKIYGDAFRTIISGKIEEIPCKIKRKKASIRQQRKDVLVTGFKVVETSRDTYYGFELDGNGRYLLGDFTVTHNTAMALWLACQFKKRTLIIVHKQFLLDQWIERIKQFIPGASIGIIKQDQCELDRDIVIGMIQTMVKREYPKGTFDSIHFTIFDEMQHLGAQGFSNIFFKTGTKLTLGLSATPIRSDGLTKVVEWFIGSMIKNEIISEIEKPTVKFIEAEYSTNITPKFNFKGVLNSADMINQLVKDPKRNQMIIDEIISLNREGRKILVLSGRREHCDFLSKEIIKIDSCITVGLYLGGMKNCDLEISNNASIIFATYTMASEGYDNPSLDTLIMSTGMGSVQQAVGRILRKKNKLSPLVIDVTDIKYFGGQANRRKQFYKKNEYKLHNSNRKKKQTFTEVEVKSEEKFMFID